MIELSRLEALLETLYRFIVPSVIVLLLTALHGALLFTGGNGPTDGVWDAFTEFVAGHKNLKDWEGVLKGWGFKVDSALISDVLGTFITSFIVMLVVIGALIRILEWTNVLKFRSTDDINFLEYADWKAPAPSEQGESSWISLRQRALHAHAMDDVNARVKQLYKQSLHLSLIATSLQISFWFLVISIYLGFLGTVNFQENHAGVFIKIIVLFLGYICFVGALSRMYHHNIYAAMNLTRRSMLAYCAFRMRDQQLAEALPREAFRVKATRVCWLSSETPWAVEPQMEPEASADEKWCVTAFNAMRRWLDLWARPINPYWDREQAPTQNNQ